MRKKSPASRWRDSEDKERSVHENLIVVAEMKAKDGQEEELRKRTAALVEPTRKEKGCVRYDLHISDADPGRFLFYEIWTSVQALQDHLKSPHMTAFLGRSDEWLAEPAKVVTYTKIA
jgi:quinol monooxygenase YgiN